MGFFDAYKNLETPPIPPYADLPDDRGQMYGVLRKLYLSHDSVAKIAHQLWVQDGRPDGEQVDQRLGAKIKDVHWWRAQMMLEVVLDTDFDTVWFYHQERENNSAT